MDIAVLSDIHGNYIALERCLEYALSKGVETFVFLGDYVAELAYPERTMDIIYNLNEKYQCYFIKGNKEEYWIKYLADGKAGWADRNSTTGALLYSFNGLTDKDMKFYKQLKNVDEINIDSMPPVLICHGSPYGTTEKMYPNDFRTNQILDSIKPSIVLFGHTHKQQKIIHNGKSALNPGSVGIPLGSEGKTQFLILRGNGGVWSDEFISLDYDVDKAINELYESKLNEHAPYWTLTTEYILRNGTISHSTVLLRAMELCENEMGECVWPDIPEKYWKLAAEEILV